MVKRFTIVCLILLAIAVLAVPACANLVPMSWGFPVMIQNNSLTGFQTATASTSDLENANIAFPTTGGSSIFGSAFPTIGQNSLQKALQTNLVFQQQTQSSIFAYPFLSIGGSPIPSMGLL
jgi:hypothetical protein